MVQYCMKRRKRVRDVGKVYNPTSFSIYWPSNVNSHTKRMSVQSIAFVFWRHIWKPVCRLDMKLLVNFH